MRILVLVEFDLSPFIQGNLEAAEIQLREALDIFKQAKGEDHQRSVATTMNNIAQLMRAQVWPSARTRNKISCRLS